MNINGIEFYTSLEGSSKPSQSKSGGDKYISILGKFYGEGKQKRTAVNNLRENILNALVESKTKSEELLKLLIQIDNMQLEEEIIMFKDAVVEGEEIAVTSPIFPLPKDLDVMNNLDEVGNFYLNNK
jgi:hypothetical protein